LTKNPKPGTAHDDLVI